jgi:F-type H+-transporting ATPase subunit gamma
MGSLKAVKRRIATVSSTQKIMRAMDLVSASKLQKARNQLDNVRPAYAEILRIVDGVRRYEDVGDNIFVREREVKSSAYVIITSDRGLCGAYNTAIANVALAHRETKGNEQLFCLGIKGGEFFQARNRNIHSKFSEISETAIYEDTVPIGDAIIGMYLNGEVDEVYIAYSYFGSALSHVPKIERILPIGGATEIDEDFVLEMEYEPDVNTFLSSIAPGYLRASIYYGLVESSCCEHAARMTSMNAAAGNADEILADLTLQYNRERQAIITQEISEIIGGSESLR